MIFDLPNWQTVILPSETKVHESVTRAFQTLLVVRDLALAGCNGKYIADFINESLKLPQVEK